MRWHLLTSLEVGSAEAAAEVAGHYVQRWRGKDYLEALKACCRGERLIFRTEDLLTRSIVTSSVIAWLLMAMAVLGRCVPDCEAALAFTNHELGFHAREHDLPGPGSVRAALRLMAHLGGYRDSDHDSDPGSRHLWQGVDRLVPMAIGYRLFLKHGAVRKNKG